MSPQDTIFYRSLLARLGPVVILCAPCASARRGGGSINVDGDDDGLSTGAIIGIIVAIIVVLILIAWCRAASKKSREKAGDSPPKPVGTNLPAGTTGTTAPASPAPTYNAWEANRLKTGPSTASHPGSEPSQVPTIMFVITRAANESAPSYSAKASDRV